MAAPLIRARCRLALRRLPAMVAVLLLSGACLAGAGLLICLRVDHASMAALVWVMAPLVAWVKH